MRKHPGGNKRYHFISYHIIPYHIILYHIIPYHIISYHIISYHIISYHIILYHIISYYIISYHIISYHIISYHIISYHIILYHIIFYGHNLELMLDSETHILVSVDFFGSWGVGCVCGTGRMKFWVFIFPNFVTCSCYKVFDVVHTLIFNDSN